MVGKIFAGIVGGLIPAILASMILAVALGDETGSVGAITFFVVWAAAFASAVMAPVTSKAWRRLLIASGLLAFAMPLATMVFTGGQMGIAAEEAGGAGAAGAALGGGAITVVAGMLGFFLGLIFLVVGLLVGRDKQVVYAQQPPEHGAGG